MKPKHTIKLKQFSALLLFLLLSWGAFAQSPARILGTGQALQDYRNNYIQEPGHKAFAISSDGSYAWDTNRSQLGSAVRAVLDLCNSGRRSSAEAKCVIADINGQLFGPYSEAETHLSTHSSIEALEGSYANSQRHKAFVQAPSGRWSWRGNRDSLTEAERDALNACNEALSEGQQPCVVINRNGQFVNP